MLPRAFFLNRLLCTTMSVPTTESIIKKALTDCFKPVHVEVINESYMHNVPKGAESHFKVLVISEEFENKPLLKRHRMVNNAIKQALDEVGKDFVHALSIETKTPKQWDASYKVEPSPNCLGGFGK